MGECRKTKKAHAAPGSHESDLVGLFAHEVIVTSYTWTLKIFLLFLLLFFPHSFTTDTQRERKIERERERKGEKRNIFFFIK